MNISPLTIIVVQEKQAGTSTGPVADMQRSLLAPLDELMNVQELLAGQVARLQEPSEAMLAEEVPFDVPAELLTTVQHVLAAYIGPAVDRLRHLVAVTPEQLRREWQAAHGSVHPAPPAHD
jgi:hypothetical protein